MRAAESPLAILDTQIRQANTSWSVGGFGAIAEFAREPNEAVTVHRHGVALTAVTARGGLRIEAQASSRLVASESPTAESWDHRVALCLPRELCAMSGRLELTEIGPDDEAIRDSEREAVLFDLGLGLAQIDACVRTTDPTVAIALRRHVGKSVFAADSGAMDVISRSHPDHVFMSRLGRTEVFGQAPSCDGKDISGPHIRLSPELIAHRHTHAATEALPGNCVPCAHFHPPNPVRSSLDCTHRFNTESHFAFQRLLEKYGDPERFALKKRLIHAVIAEYEPFAIHNDSDRFSRATVVVTLRQLQAWNTQSATLAAWLAEYDLAKKKSDQAVKQLPQSLLAMVRAGAG